MDIFRSIIANYRRRRRLIRMLKDFERKQINADFKTDERCGKPQLNIAFLKTHKTGSSTITNILNRFSETHNLTVALPADGFSNFLWPLPFQTDFVQNRARKPNIVSNHARFNALQMMELMPATTKYITILRHPSTQFPSLFKFMDLGGLIGVNGDTNTITLEYFLDNAAGILKSLQERNPQILIDNPSLYLLRNPQLFDLGFDQSVSENERKIREIIAKISKKFAAVLIMDYFDESLVLLKRKMCWTIEDIVYFKLNKQLEMNTHLVTPSIRAKILQWTKADVMLYEYFNESLWNQVRKEGVGFWGDVALLRKRNKELSGECLRTGLFLNRPYTGSTAIIYGHSLKGNLANNLKTTCKRMIRSEINYIKHFRTVYQRV